ncbi:MAG TPA: cyclic nucleotide-binding domain-containing protein [Planctomycetota bacterium]|nr:cyclic nucleotide-binding domain-containing protein [Planctomycetota bacterium]
MTEMSQAVRDALVKCELFRGLGDEDRARVFGLARACSFGDGAPIVREDEEAKELFLIVDGRADVQVRWPFKEGDSQQIGQVRRGDVIGEVALVDRCLRSATVRAVGPVEAVAVPNDALRRLCEESPPLGYRVMENVARLLAGRMRETNLKLRNTIANLIY